MKEQQKAFGLLKGQCKEYESFDTTMMKPPMPSYNDTAQLLQSYENMRTLHIT